MADETQKKEVATRKKKQSAVAENMLLSLVTQFFKRASVAVGIWMMGYFDFSISWLLLGLVVWVWKDKQHRERKLRVEANQQCVIDERATILARVDDLPSWVFFPDVERAEWLNKMIDQMWPYVGDYVKQMLVDTVEPKVREAHGALKSFKFAKIDLGDIPPRIGGVKVYTDAVKRDEIIMDLSLIYASDADIEVSIKGIKAGLKDLQLRGNLRIVFKPLISVTPLIGGFSVFFINNPDIDFNLTSLANAFDIPGLNDMLHTIVSEQIANVMVLPNRIPIQLAPGADLTKLRYPMPAGVVRVFLIEAKDLKKADIGFGKKGKSDPYTVASIGAKRYKTKVINDNITPEWNESFEAVVDVSDGQFLELEVKDEDPGSKDDPLGDTNIDLGPVFERGTIDSWIPLENIKTGLIHVKLQWLYLANDPLELEKVVKQMKAAKQLDDFSSCILMVNLDSARGLPRSKKNMQEPNPFVTLSLGQEKKESTVKMATNEPKWEENFRFLVHDPHFQELNLIVGDKKAGNDIGRVDIPLKTLLTATDMMIEQKFNIRNALAESQLNLRLTLRVLSTERKAEWFEEEDIGSPVDGAPDAAAATAAPAADKKEADKARAPEAAPAKKPETVGSRSETSVSKPEGDVIPPARSAGPASSAPDVRQRKGGKNDGRGEFGKGRIQMTLRYNPQRKALVVVVHKCVHLLGLDSNNLSDPYVRLYLLPDKSRSSKRKTDVKKDCLEPVWDEQFEYNVSPTELGERTLEVSVKNDNSMFSSSKDMMGQVLIDLSSMDQSKAVTEWFDIQPDETANKVKIACESDV